MSSPKENSFLSPLRHILDDYIKPLAIAALLALSIRSFIVEPYQIPSKSMVPTLLVGDHIFVNRFIYGLRIPFTKKWLVEWGGPKRGDVIVFTAPPDETESYIKRAIGIPGDKITIKDDKLYVNGQSIENVDVPVIGVNPEDRRYLYLKPSEEQKVSEEFRKLPYFNGFENYQIKIEKLGEKNHLIQRNRLLPNDLEVDITVPPDSYFVMGDNRDHSNDSRYWGFVPRNYLKGQALFIWISRDRERGGLFETSGWRGWRFGKKII